MLYKLSVPPQGKYNSTKLLQAHENAGLVVEDFQIYEEYGIAYIKFDKAEENRIIPILANQRLAYFCGDEMMLHRYLTRLYDLRRDVQMARDFLTSRRFRGYFQRIDPQSELSYSMPGFEPDDKLYFFLVDDKKLRRGRLVRDPANPSKWLVSHVKARQQELVPIEKIYAYRAYK